MTNPDYRAMCAELINELSGYKVANPMHDRSLLNRARLLMAEADGPAVPDGREPASVATQPSDEELLEKGPSLEEVEELCEEHCFNVEGYESLECLQGLINDALARWGHQPAPPAEGEPSDNPDYRVLLIKLTSHMAYMQEKLEEHHQLDDSEDYYWYRESVALQQRVAGVLAEPEAKGPRGRPAAAPVPVSERLPEPNTKVLAHYFNCLGKGRTICAIWVPAKSRSDDYGDDDFTEYDEEGDKFYWPEGWYEVIENWDELGWVKVDEGEIAYWQPLPKWPANALPLPAPEGGKSQP